MAREGSTAPFEPPERKELRCEEFLRNHDVDNPRVAMNSQYAWGRRNSNVFVSLRGWRDFRWRNMLEPSFFKGEGVLRTLPRQVGNAERGWWRIRPFFIKFIVDGII